ncbi:MAG: hypothetical protein ACK5IM_04360, partial [Demequina sp.]|uniref:hypothetical protein n=1 Tax=Demequina sp. TaxID=2050685 RepID=UPI003A85FAF1
PPVGTSSAQGESVAITANGVGGPKISNASWDANDAGDKVTFSVDVASAGAGSTTLVGVAPNNSRCTPNTTASGGSVSITVGVESNTLIDFTVCAESRWKDTAYGTATIAVDDVYAYRDPGAPRVTKGYDVGDTCRTGFSAFSCETRWWGPEVDRAPSGFELRYVVNGAGATTNFSLENAFGSRPTVTARYCPTFLGSGASCSDNTSTVGPVSEQRAYPTSVSITACTVTDSDRHVNMSVAAQGGDYTVSYEWRDGWGQPTDVQWDIDRVKVTVDFQGALAGIETFSPRALSCDNSATDQTPSPEPTEPETPSPEPTEPETAP